MAYFTWAATGTVAHAVVPELRSALLISRVRDRPDPKIFPTGVTEHYDSEALEAFSNQVQRRN